MLYDEWEQKIISKGNDKQLLHTWELCNELDNIFYKGIPQSSIFTLYGEPKCGKTRLSIDIMNRLIEQGVSCVYFNSDNMIIDTNLLTPDYIINVSTFDSFLSEYEHLINNEIVDFIIVDSIASLLSGHEDIHTAEDYKYFKEKLFTILTSISSYLYDTNSSLLFIDQVRSDLKGHKLNFGGDIIRHFSDIVIRQEKHNIKGNYLDLKLIQEKNIYGDLKEMEYKIGEIL